MDGSGAVRCRVGVRVLRAVRLRAPPQQMVVSSGSGGSGCCGACSDASDGAGQGRSGLNSPTEPRSRGEHTDSACVGQKHGLWNDVLRGPLVGCVS